MEASNESYAHEDSAILQQYLAPNESDKELVVLTDNKSTASVVATQSNTAAFSGQATRILRRGLLGMEEAETEGLSPQKLATAIGAGPTWGEADEWLRDAAAAGLFSITTAPPKITNISSADVSKDYRIPALGGIPLDQKGRLLQATVNRTHVYWFASAVPLKRTDDYIVGSVIKPSAEAPVVSLLPQRRFGGVAANCNGCGLCAVCGACGACGLCGGIDLAAALVAVDAVLGSVIVVNASSLTTLRPQDF